MRTETNDGASLAKGPTAVVGVVLLAFGILALIGGAHGFDISASGGGIDGEMVLGLEVNGWSAVLFAAAGVVLLLGAPLHWGAKGTSLAAGLVLGAASVIALFDGRDVFGVFAANGWTALAWGAASTVLLVIASLPRRRPTERSITDPVRTVVTPAPRGGAVSERRKPL